MSLARVQIYKERYPMRHSSLRGALAAVLSLCVGAPVLAQKSTADGIAEYREMLQDGNPAELFEMKGEELWKQKRRLKTLAANG